MKFQPHRSISTKEAVLWWALAVVLFAAIGCAGGNVSTPTPGTGMVTVSISDPPSCMAPNGSSTSFTHVFITVRSVQAHIDPRADDNSSNWQELAPQLASAPMQIDLFATPTNCVLAQLGSASLPVGSYQQIRLLLVSNSPGTTLTKAAKLAATPVAKAANSSIR